MNSGKGRANWVERRGERGRSSSFGGNDEQLVAGGRLAGLELRASRSRTCTAQTPSSHRPQVPRLTNLEQVLDRQPTAIHAYAILPCRSCVGTPGPRERQYATASLCQAQRRRRQATLPVLHTPLPRQSAGRFLGLWTKTQLLAAWLTRLMGNAVAAVWSCISPENLASTPNPTRRRGGGGTSGYATRLRAKTIHMLGHDRRSCDNTRFHDWLTHVSISNRKPEPVRPSAAQPVLIDSRQDTYIHIHV